jgi:hypothetical protein
MEQVATLLGDARAAGLEIRVEADRLVVRGSPVYEQLARQLLEEKPAVLAVLAQEDAEVAWRIEAMRPQVPVRGPIPALIARRGPYSSTGCISCGMPLAENAGFRCAACARAAWLVLNEVREGVGPES